jgi:hypothetical protein
MRSAILAGTCLALMSLTASAQSPASASETERILALENAWNGAEISRDVRSLNLLLAETFVYTDDDGTYMNKDSWLEKVKNKTDQYQQLANSDVTVRMYEKTAVVTGVYRGKIQIKGKIVERSGRFTDTWIQQKSEWKCVASQSTLVSR